MSDAFDTILGQPKVREYLRRSVEIDKPSHAYLFAGPAGSNKTSAAFALARALLCPNPKEGQTGGICGKCENCTRVNRRSHPDVKYIKPEGANGYLVDQIREIVSDVSFAPIQADKKIYILDRVDILGTQAANAFLKTLEEPPDNVVFILLGRTRDSVLSTISSRCQVIPFRQIPPTEACGIIAQNTGDSIENARFALEATNGSITNAVSFLNSYAHERMQFRSWLLRRLADISSMNDWEILLFAKDIISKSKAPLDEVINEQKREIEDNSEFLAKSTIKQIEAKNKRYLSAKSQEFIDQSFSIIRSWLRDILVACSNSDDLIQNTDYLENILEVSKKSTSSKIAYALHEIENINSSLNYNISPETCIDVALFAVREVFNGASCTN